MFPERLREARKAKDLTQREMASRLCLSQQAYAKYEVGTAKPNSDTLAQIAGELGVSVDYLLATETKNPADNVSEATRELLSKFEADYSQLTEANKEKAAEYIRLLLGSQK